MKSSKQWKLKVDISIKVQEILSVPILTVSVADPGSGAFLSPGSGMEKIQIQDPGWTSRILVLRT
jgi:hypothetical protein